jgi:hypothetical protein
VEFDSVNERVLVYGSSVRGALAQCLTVELAGTSDIVLGDSREWDELDGIDLDLTLTDPITAALPHLRPGPQPDRERDVSSQDVIAQLAAELHTMNASRATGALTELDG